MVMTGESFENYIPRLVPFVRGPLWRVKLQRPSLYRALRPMVWVAYFAAVATLAQPGWVEFAVTHLMWSHVGAVLGLYIVAIMFAALALAQASCKRFHPSRCVGRGSQTVRTLSWRCGPS